MLYCSLCAADKTCLICQDNFVLANNSCLCRDGFTPNLPGLAFASCECTSGNCSTCAIPGCLACSSNGTSCTTCAAGYMATGFGSCVVCDVTNCSRCYTNNFCGECMGGLKPSLEGQCVVCDLNITGCLSCNDNGRCNCMTGYSENSVSDINQCILCEVERCQSCSGPNECALCVSGYYVENGTCKASSSYLAVIYDGCPEQCNNCHSSNLSCIECNTFLYSQYPNANGTCFKCATSYCSVCEETNPFRCTVCRSGYDLTDSGCVFNQSRAHCS